MTGYTKTKTFTTGETINAGDFTTEFNNVSVAFDESTGHTHNGDADSGAYVPLISSADTFTKITTTEATNQLNFYTNVSGAAALQLSFKDGVIEPNADSDVDIGTTAKRFKDLYIDSATVTGTVTADKVKLGNNEFIELGNNSELKLHFNGTDSYIAETGSGNLRIAADDFRVQNGNATITLIQANDGGSTALHWGGGTNTGVKLETKQSGVDVSGDLDVTGTMSATNATIAGTASFEDQIIILGATAQDGAQPTLTLRSNENASSDNQLGEITFQGHNNQQVDQTYAYMRAESPVITDNQEEGKLKFFVRKTGNAYANSLSVDSSGIDVTGTVTADGVKLGDNDKLQFGNVTTPDLEIYHTGSHSIIEDLGTGNLVIRGASIELKNASNKSKIFIQNGADGAVKISHGDDEADTLITTATGINVTGTVAASDGLTADYIDLTGGESTTTTGTIACKMIVLNDSSTDQSDGSTIFTEANSVDSNDSSLIIQQSDDAADYIKLRLGSGGAGTLVDVLTASTTGIDVIGTVDCDGLKMDDGEYARFGNSGDLQIFHSGVHSYIQDQGTGILSIQTNGDSITFADSANTRNMAKFSVGGTASLSWAGTDQAGVKLATTATGIDVTGTLSATNATIAGTASFEDTITITASTAQAASQPRFILRSNETSPANNNLLGEVVFQGHDSINIDTTYAYIRAYSDVVTNNAEEGSLKVFVKDGALNDNPLTINKGGIYVKSTVKGLNFQHDNDNVTDQSWSSFARNGISNVLYVQQGVTDKAIASFRKGSTQAGQGTEVLGVSQNGINVTGNVGLSGAITWALPNATNGAASTDSPKIEAVTYGATNSTTALDFVITDDANQDRFRFRGSYFNTTDVNDDGVFNDNLGYHSMMELYSTDSNSLTSAVLDVAGTVEANAFSGTGAVAITDFIDDDSFDTATATTVPTAESVKAYVNAQTAAASAGDITSIVAGDGLTGGATSGVATVTVVGGVGIVANADEVVLDLSELTASEDNAHGDFFAVVDSSNLQKKLTKANIALSGMNNDSGWTTSTGTVTEVTVGTGLDVSNGTTAPALSLDFTEFSDMTADVAGSTEVILNNAGTESRKAISEIKLSTFNNDLTFDNTDTTYTAGTGLTLSASYEFSVNVAQTQITSVGTLSALNVTGDLTLNGSYPTGTQNTFVGEAARSALTETAIQNVGVGSSALGSLTTGDDNSAIGNSALASVTTGSDSVAIGRAAGFSSTTGSANIAIGKASLYTGVSASSNTAIGNSALYALTAGNYNVAIGENAGRRLTAGASNTYIGKGAGYNADEQAFAVAIGKDAGVGAAPDGATVNFTGGDNNVAIGNATLFSQTTGFDNIAIGKESLKDSTTAYYCTAVGTNALTSVTTGTVNTAVGHRAGEFVTTSTASTAIGMYACRKVSTGNYNTGIGWRALSGDAGLNNFLTGNNNVAIGSSALTKLHGASISNIAIGTNAGLNLTEGNGNLLIGNSAGASLTEASNQTIIGQFNGNASGLDLGANTTARLVLSTGVTPVVVATNANFDIMVGAALKAWSTTTGGVRFTGNGGTSTMNWSRPSTATGNVNAARYYHNGAQIGGVVTTTTGTSYNTSSDYRLKENVAPLTDSIDRLKALKPCTFNFLTEPSRNEEGFIAHEVQEVVPQAVDGIKDAVDADGNIEVQSLSKTSLIPLLTSALQEAIEKIEQLEERISALEV